MEALGTVDVQGGEVLLWKSPNQKVGKLFVLIKFDAKQVF